jgi:hypothetical protein
MNPNSMLPKGHATSSRAATPKRISGNEIVAGARPQQEKKSGLLRP